MNINTDNKDGEQKSIWPGNSFKCLNKLSFIIEGNSKANGRTITNSFLKLSLCNRLSGNLLNV